MKIAIIAIMPYSAGVKRRANIRPTKKVTPELDMLSIKLHFAPWTALFFKDSDKDYCKLLPGQQPKYSA